MTTYTRNKDWVFNLATIVVIIFLVIGVYVLFTTTDPIRALVSGHHWTREIKIEDYRPRAYEGWDETVPSDAYNRTCDRRVRSTSRVVSGEDCNSRGTCEPTYRTANNYDTYCYYTADRWAYVYSLTSRGDDYNAIPYWLNLDFELCSNLAYECKRENGRVENYWIDFSNTDYQFSCPIPGYMYREYRIETLYSLDMGRFIHIPRCETLTRAR